jgi:hypothetical protein
LAEQVVRLRCADSTIRVPLVNPPKNYLRHWVVVKSSSVMAFFILPLMAQATHFYDTFDEIGSQCVSLPTHFHDCQFLFLFSFRFHTLSCHTSCTTLIYRMLPTLQMDEFICPP